MQPSEDQIKSSILVSVKSVENYSVETRSQDEDTWTEPLDIVTDEENETWFIRRNKMLEKNYKCYMTMYLNFILYDL